MLSAERMSLVGRPTSTIEKNEPEWPWLRLWGATAGLPGTSISCGRTARGGRRSCRPRPNGFTSFLDQASTKAVFGPVTAFEKNFTRHSGGY